LPENILCGTIKFTESFVQGDTIRLIYGTSGIEKGTYGLYDLTGNLAIDNTWKKDTVGIINFDLDSIKDGENGKAYIQSATPLWI
jgi:hypothetical protein